MKLFIWDFHGTLEQGNEFAVLEISNTILKNSGYTTPFTRDECIMLYGRRWWEYFEFKLPAESHEKHLELQSMCIEFQRNNKHVVLKNIQLANDALKVLTAIDKIHDQILVSNSDPVSLGFFLNTVGIESFFPDGKRFAVNFHQCGITKAQVCEKYIIHKSYDQVYCIGDSESDMQLGESIGATNVLYTHPHLIPKDAHAHYKINNLVEILKFI